MITALIQYTIKSISRVLEVILRDLSLSHPPSPPPREVFNAHETTYSQPGLMIADQSLQSCRACKKCQVICFCLFFCTGTAH